MWLRDAAVEDSSRGSRSSTIRDYFPYRWGHAFWAYVAGRLGDADRGGEIARSGAGAARRAEAAVERDRRHRSRPRGMKRRRTDDRSGTRRFARSTASPLRRSARRREAADGRIIGGGRARPMNVGPHSARTARARVSLGAGSAVGRPVPRRRHDRAGHSQTDFDGRRSAFQSLQFLMSAGTWDPKGGRSRSPRCATAIRCWRSSTRRTARSCAGDHVRDLDEIFQPAWSPDGKPIAFSAQAGGFTDLYVHDPGGTDAALTNDAFADLQPAWSPDGTADRVRHRSIQHGTRHAQLRRLWPRDDRRPADGADAR